MCNSILKDLVKVIPLTGIFFIISFIFTEGTHFLFNIEFNKFYSYKYIFLPLLDHYIY